MWLQWALDPKKEHRQLLMAKRDLGTLSMTKTRRGPWNLSGALDPIPGNEEEAGSKEEALEGGLTVGELDPLQVEDGLAVG